MFTAIVFLSCLYYPLSLGQMDTSFTQPSIGTIYPVANNDSLVNITLNYPLNYRFDNLTVSFTIYEFTTSNTTIPIIYPFSALNFYDSNFSDPSVQPQINFQTGSHLIICFEWIQTNYSGFIVNDTYNCILTRTAVNGLILPTDNPNISTPLIDKTRVVITGSFPKTLPFDQVNITSTLNSTIIPSVSDLTANGNYSYSRTFTFQNLVPDTTYVLCTNFTYWNSMVRGFLQSTGSCQILTTSKNHALNNSCNRYLLNIMLIILFVLFVSI